MTRPYIEFIELKDLISEPLMNSGIPTGIRVKRLSEDSETRAVSFFASIPPLWTRRATGYYESAVELMIIEGNLRIGETQLSAGGYSYLPAGAFQGPAVSDQGCRLLMLFDGAPGFIESEVARAGAREDLRITCIDTNALAWEQPPTLEGRSANEAAPGLFVKWLRVDPDTTAYTLMTKHEPGWSDPRPESHTNWEELFLMEGDYLMGTFGMMTAGGYIFRPPTIPHGPQATKRGAVWLARGDKMCDFTLQEVPWADEMIERYLTASHLF
jgi:hypothetical protein